MNIDSKAVIDSRAEIGRDVQVGAGAVVGSDVKIGDRCVVGPNAVIMPYTTLGEDCRVHAGAVIGDTPQDLSFKHLVSHVRIGARCTFREGVTIHRGTKEGTETVVGDDCYLMANSHLAHNVILGNRVILANGALLGGYVEIGDGAFISGNAVIHQFCRVGRLVMVGGLSGISKDVPPFCMTRSGAVNTIVGFNIVGLRRNGFSPEQRNLVKTCYDIIYRQGRNVSQAIEKLQAEPESPVIHEIVSFIQKSKRGICKFSSRGEEEE
ncbi:MAG TPA: acyl-ACP--UDP-N-acetylglucosamine O-acyltransferase [Kiritimatiellia bacterium]|nr:acyl-ACP--UDP-N-acetylglucosamine O-acyltransferase [Kiritimatiellia bacterium]